jgi:DNA polymerase-4
MRQEGYVGRVVAVKLRDSRFRTRIRQRVLERHCDDPDVFYGVAMELFSRLWDGGPVRLLGVTAQQLSRAPGPRQAWVFSWQERSLRLRESVDQLRDRFGEASVVRAGALASRRRLKHVPFGAVRTARP